MLSVRELTDCKNIKLAKTTFVSQSGGQPHSAYLLIGSLLYLIGTIGVTIAFNVPLNDALASVKPGSPEGATLWSKYLTNWTLWNHVRTVAALISTLLFTIALSK